MRCLGLLFLGGIGSLTAGQASAAGFLLNDQGARATGRANAVVATATDGSAVFHNPAGIAFSKGWSFCLGASVVSPNASYEDLDGNLFTADSGVSVVPTFYANGLFTKLIAGGIGLTAPFGSHISWPADTPGGDILRSQTLRTFFITPVVAFNLSEWLPELAVGLGADFVPASVELERDVVFGEDVGDAHLGGDAFGAGGRLGAMYRPDFIPGLSVGLSWRSEVHLGFSGYVDFDADPPFRAQLPPDGPINTTLILPQSLLLGVAYTFGPIEAEIDLNYVNWSRQPEVTIRLPDGSDSIQTRSYRDTVVFRAGGELNLWEMDLAMRVGYAFDPTPVPARTLDITLPDVDRHVFTAGGTYYLPHEMFVHAGLVYSFPAGRKTKDKPLTPVLKGDYRLAALVATLSFGVTFGADPRPVPKMGHIPWLMDPGGPLGQ